MAKGKVTKRTAIELKSKYVKAKKDILAGKKQKMKIAAGDGLYLVVRSSADGVRAAWYLRGQEAGGHYEHGLRVSYPEASLADARGIAMQHLSLSRQAGVNPVELGQREKERRMKLNEERRREKNALTVDEFAPDAIKSKCIAEQDVHREFQRRMSQYHKYISPVIGSLRLDKVTPRDAFNVIRRANQPINKGLKYSRSLSSGIPAAATQKKVFSRLKDIFTAAKAAGLVKSNPLRSEEFAELKEGIEPPKYVALHQGALPPEDMPDFCRELCELIVDQTTSGFSSTPARILLFTILLGLRPGNARYCAWDDIEGSVWTIPASRMKVRQNGAHIVYLPRQAIDLIHAQPRLENSAFVFPGRRADHPLCDAVFTKAIVEINSRKAARGERAWRDDRQSKATGIDVKITPHGLARSGLKTWSETVVDASTGLPFNPSVAEICLHHVKTDGAKYGGAYAREDFSDETRRMWKQWADFCLSKVPGEMWDVIKQPIAKKVKQGLPE